MGLFQRFSSVVRPSRVRGMTTDEYNTAFWSGDSMVDAWMSSLSAAGVAVTPDLGMTLAAMYCGVTTIAYDLATLPLQTLRMHPDDDGVDVVRGKSADWAKGGIGDLAYMLRWAPNDYQTATEFTVGQVAQWLLRDVAYAEIKDGPSGFLAQLLPRHPDRVFPERLPNGNMRYKLIEANGQPRYVTKDEMHVVRGLSADGISRVSRVQYGSNVLGTALAAERAAGKFFKSGMTAAMLASYKGDVMDEEALGNLHLAISKYAAGVDNNFGLMLVPDDVTVSNLGVEPDKAQMMLAREWGAREVARLLRIPPHKLMIAGTTTYASQVQSATDYVVGCLRPVAHTFEQAIQRDLILAKDTYFVRFQLAELLRGDPAARADYYSKAIASRWMRPSEVRLAEGYNPDPDLDRLSEGDNRPGQSGDQPKQLKPAEPPPQEKQDQNARAQLKTMLAFHDNAVRCLRRERAAVEKLAKKHANDVDGWQRGLREFYGEHAGFIAQTMRMSITCARGFAAQHGSEFEAKGTILIDGDAGVAWESYEADELCALALDVEAAA